MQYTHLHKPLLGMVTLALDHIGPTSSQNGQITTFPRCFKTIGHYSASILNMYVCFSKVSPISSVPIPPLPNCILLWMCSGSEWFELGPESRLGALPSRKRVKSVYPQDKLRQLQFPSVNIMIFHYFDRMYTCIYYITISC